VALGGGLIPLDIHRDVLPAVRLELGGHEVGLLPDLCFVRRGAEGVPAIPAQRRRGGPLTEIVRWRRCYCRGIHEQAADEQQES
jgi:hypothetical protein